MIYYVSKVFWLIAAPTNVLVLISAIAALWAALGRLKCAAWLAAAAACGLVIGAFTPIGLALRVPLENRFPSSPPDPQAPPDGIIILGGSGRIKSPSILSHAYPKARLAFIGLSRRTSRDLAILAVTPRALRSSPNHGQPPKMHCTRPRCSNQNPVKGGCWSPQPCICRAL
jgi:hypothetical protein